MLHFQYLPWRKCTYCTGWLILVLCPVVRRRNGEATDSSNLQYSTNTPPIHRGNISLFPGIHWRNHQQPSHSPKTKLTHQKLHPRERATPITNHRLPPLNSALIHNLATLFQAPQLLIHLNSPLSLGLILVYTRKSAYGRVLIRALVGLVEGPG